MANRNGAIALALFYLVLIPFPAPAQARGDGWARCNDAEPGTAAIQGRLVPYEPGIRLDRGVMLRGDGVGPDCWAEATPDGRFEFRGLPAGTYTLDLGSHGYPSFSRAPIRVAEGATAQLVVPVYRRDFIRECVSEPGCASILVRRTPAEAIAADEFSLRMLAYRVSLIVAGGDDADADWVACVEDDSAAMEVLRSVYPRVADAAECDQRRFRRRPFQHTPSGQPARVLHVPRVETRAGSTAMVALGYTASGLNGAIHECTFERTEQVWTLRTCELRAIS